MAKIGETFKVAEKSKENLVIDETTVPYRDKFRFRQYIPGKVHKYKTKLFKLIHPKSYTYNACVYEGRFSRIENGNRKSPFYAWNSSKEICKKEKPL